MALAVTDDPYRRHHHAVVAFCERRAPGRGEELAQETWLRMVRAAPDCPDDASFRAYAFTTARRVLVDHHRRRLARPTLTLVQDTPEDRVDVTPHDDAVASQLAEVIDRALADAKPEILEVFHARIHDDISFKELAARQGVSINTALGRMHRAVLRVRRALTEAGLLDGSQESP